MTILCSLSTDRVVNHGFGVEIHDFPHPKLPLVDMLCERIENIRKKFFDPWDQLGISFPLFTWLLFLGLYMVGLFLWDQPTRKVKQANHVEPRRSCWLSLEVQRNYS